MPKPGSNLGSYSLLYPAQRGVRGRVNEAGLSHERQMKEKKKGGDDRGKGAE